MKVSDLIRRPIPPINIFHHPVHGKHSKKEDTKKENKKGELEESLKDNFNPHLGENVDEHHKSLTSHHKDSWENNDNSHVNDYTGTSRNINSALIDYAKSPLNSPGEQKEKIDGIDRVLNNSKAKSDLHVFHGTGWNVGKESNKHPQGLINLPAYTSTTIRPEFAASMAKTDNEGKRHILHIHVKKGHHGIYIGDHSQYPKEKEFLLHRNTILKVHPEPEIKEHEGVKYHVWHAETQVSKPQNLDRDISVRSRSKQYKKHFDEVINGPDIIKKVDLISKNPHVSNQIVDRVHDEAKADSDYNHDDRLTKLLSHPNLSKHHIDAAIHNSYELTDVAKNPSLEKHHIDKIIAGSPPSSIVRSISKNKNFGSEHIDKIVKSDDMGQIAKRLAIQHPKTSAETLDHIIKNSPDSGNRYDAIQHRNLSDKTFDHILNNGDKQEKRQLVASPKFTPDHLKTLIDNHHPDDNLAIHDAIFSHHIKSDHIDRLLNHPDPDLRAQIPNAPHHLINDHHITKMLQDPNSGVARTAITELGHKLKNSHMMTAVSHPSDAVKLEAVRSPRAEEKILHKALKSNSPEIRKAVVSHPNANETHFAKAVSDPSENVRSVVAKKTSSLETMNHLMKDSSNHVKQNLLTNHNLQQKHFDHIMKNSDDNMKKYAMDRRTDLVQSDHIHRAIEGNYLTHTHAHDLNGYGKMNPSHFEKMATSPHVEQQSIAAGYTKDSNLVHRLLRHSSNKDVKYEAVMNHHLGSGDIHKIIDDHHKDTHLMHSLIQREDLTPEHLEKLHQKAHPSVINNLDYSLHSRHLPDSLIDHVASSDHISAIKSLTTNPNLKPEHISKIVKNKKASGAVSNIIEHPSFDFKKHGTDYIKNHLTNGHFHYMMGLHRDKLTPTHKRLIQDSPNIHDSYKKELNH